MVGEGVEAAQEKLGLDNPTATVRALIGSASLDLPPCVPTALGRHVAKLNEEIAARRAEHLKELGQEPQIVDPAMRKQYSVQLDRKLFSTVAIFQSFMGLDNRAEAGRAVLSYGLELFEQGDPRVEAFLAAYRCYHRPR